MLARSSKVNHPIGIEVETPLLVPSFSSKGFTFKNEDVSELVDALDVSKEFLIDSILISAYDIHHKHIPFDEKYQCTELTIIDSGGYETSHVYDLSTTTKYKYPIKEWTLKNLEQIINIWPEHKAAIIVSYDHGTERVALEKQINMAIDLFSRHPRFLNDFLIKPETNNQTYIQMENVLGNINKFSSFSIIGVTEKELGNSILKRMLNIAKIRTSLDEAKISAPIHIFGSLDPITSILYFLSGAEIFDGLTWLKYSYYNGSAIYPSNYGALCNELGIHVRDSKVRSMSIVNNIYYLDKMKYIMKDFVKTVNFNLFDSLGIGIGDYLKKSFDTFESNLR